MLSIVWTKRIGLLFISVLAVTGALGSNPIAAKADTPDPVEPYVNLYGQRTDVLIGDEVILILSVVNPITSPGDLVVQLTLRIPSGWSVTSTEFSTATTGLATAVYRVEKGAQRHISVSLRANEPYQGQITGNIDYYVEGDEAKHHTESNLPVVAQKEALKEGSDSDASEGSRRGTPWVIVGVVLGVISAAGYVVSKRF
jgi:hypothetical protein